MSSRAMAIFFRTASYLVSALLTLCIFCTAVSGVSAVSIGNDDYMVKSFGDQRTVNLLAEKLMERYDTIAEEENIPSEVLMEAVGTGYIKSVQYMVVRNTHYSATIDFGAVTDIENRYAKAIDKYDGKNDIERTDEQLDRIIERSVTAFNETCSISNNAQLSPIASFISTRSIQLLTIGAAGAVICIVALVILNKRRRKSYNYVAMSMVSAGEIIMAFCGIILLGNRLGGLTLTNIEAYNLAIISAARTTLLELLILGAVITVAGAALFYTVFKYYKRKLMELDTESEIAKNLIRDN